MTNSEQVELVVTINGLRVSRLVDINEFLKKEPVELGWRFGAPLLGALQKQLKGELKPKRKKKSAPTPRAARESRPVASQEAQVPATPAPAAELSPQVQEIADTYPRGFADPELDWWRAMAHIHALVNGGTPLAQLVTASTQYRRQIAAAQAFARQNGKPIPQVMAPSEFFSTDAHKGPFPMPEDPDVADAARETAMSNTEWLNSEYARR